MTATAATEAQVLSCGGDFILRTTSFWKNSSATSPASVLLHAAMSSQGCPPSSKSFSSEKNMLC